MTDTAASQEVQQLKAEIVKLKMENERLKAAVFIFTEDEANEMLEIVNKTGKSAEELVNVSTDMSGPCSPYTYDEAADIMGEQGQYIYDEAKKLFEILTVKGSESLSSREVEVDMSAAHVFPSY